MNELVFTPNKTINMDLKLRLHPFSHQRCLADAKRLIDKDHTFLFCFDPNFDSNDTHKLHLVYGAMFRSGWEVRVLPVEYHRENMLDMLILCNTKVASYIGAIEKLKGFLVGFAEFTPLPVINLASGMSIEQAEKEDYERERAYGRLLKQYNHIYSKLSAYVDTKVELIHNVATISELQYYSTLQFICKVKTNHSSFNLMIGKKDIHTVGAIEELTQEQLDLLCDLCDNY